MLEFLNEYMGLDVTSATTSPILYKHPLEKSDDTWYLNKRYHEGKEEDRRK
jgi:hypothetical protein